MFAQLIKKSVLHRKGPVILTLCAMTLSILVLLAVEHVRQQAKRSFSSSVSGVDLIVGSRTGQINLLLYSVFRIGSPTSNMSWHNYQKLKQSDAVAWAIPLSLGDSHKGFRVLGTNEAYFEHFRFGEKTPLSFQAGQAFQGLFQVVLGAQVAKKLGYQLGDKITLSHGIGSTSFSHHKQAPFKVVGILHATGTPIDQTLHVSLAAIEAIHLPVAVLKKLINSTPPENINAHLLTPKSITAVMLGLTSNLRVFNVQREINTLKDEPLMAILPGVALSELWRSMSVFESSLRLISMLVFISALFGLSAMLLSSIKARSKEIKLLRMIGASPSFIYWFIACEALLITFISALLAIIFLTTALSLGNHYLLSHYGLTVSINIFSPQSALMLGIIFLFTLIAALPPALSAFGHAKNAHG